MARPLHFIARALFLAFFALNAWNTLKDLNKFHMSFSKNYVKFEKAFTKKTGYKFPEFMASGFMEANSENLVRGIAFAQLALCATALFILPGLTALVGLVYFILSIVHFNVLDITYNKFAEWEPIALSAALLAAAVYLSLPSASGCMSKVASKAKAASQNSAQNSAQKNKKKA